MKQYEGTKKKNNERNLTTKQGLCEYQTLKMKEKIKEKNSKPIKNIGYKSIS